MPVGCISKVFKVILSTGNTLFLGATAVAPQSNWHCLVPARCPGSSTLHSMVLGSLKEAVKDTCWEFQALNEMHTLACFSHAPCGSMFKCRTFFSSWSLAPMFSGRKAAGGPGSCPNVIKPVPHWPRKKSQASTWQSWEYCIREIGRALTLSSWP